VKKQPFKSFNVLESDTEGNRLWNFALERNEVRLTKKETALAPQTLPSAVYVKDWHNLPHPRLNIAWLPATQVFLKVVQLPAADRQELMAMLEFQLEKLSPLPVPQIIWSVEVLPSEDETMQTAVLCIVSRDVVESYLGKLEEQNFQADRLEVPRMEQILADGTREDGAWIYPGRGSESNLCLAAWWSGGVLRDLQLMRLPLEVAGEAGAGNTLAARAAVLHEQLMQIAWAGELEGWLNLPVKWHLVADEQTAPEWQAIVAEWSEEAVAVQAPITDESLAKFSAGRAARGEGGSNLLPAEFAARYRQQYVDRLWMGGLGALIGLYVFGALIYLVALNIYQYRQAAVQTEVVSLGPTYTNVLELKERAQVLQEQLDLKYAALDSFKAASELLPPEFTLVNLVFSQGKSFQIYGTAPAGQETNVTYYNEQMRQAMVNGKPLFSSVTPPSTYSRPGSRDVNWNFDCKLNRSDE
jgi:hypothetical protein